MLPQISCANRDNNHCQHFTEKEVLKIISSKIECKTGKDREFGHRSIFTSETGRKH